MSFLNFFIAQMEDILIRLKVSRLELAKIQADLERLLIMEHSLTIEEAKRILKVSKSVEALRKSAGEDINDV